MAPNTTVSCYDNTSEEQKAGSEILMLRAITKTRTLDNRAPGTINPSIFEKYESAIVHWPKPQNREFFCLFYVVLFS